MDFCIHIPVICMASINNALSLPATQTATQRQRLNKIETILLIFLVCFYSGVASARPNIILIVADNQSSSLIGAYGNKEIKTPNIDQLAREGIRFNYAFSVNGVCSPTRATLFTGLMPSQTGVHVALPWDDIKVSNWSAIREFQSLPQSLSEAGYSTALVGKYHLGVPDKPQLGFQYWVTFPSGHTTTFYDQTVIDNGKRYVVSEHLTDFWTKKAIHFLSQQTRNKPFFLYLAYNGPYMLPPTVNMKPNNRHAAYYTKNTPAMPAKQPVHPYLKNWAEGIRSPTTLMVKEGTTALEAIKTLNNPIAMINAASETTMVDDGVGTLMQALKEMGLDDNTIVIYTSDQGAAYGQHGLWGNTSWSFPFTVYNINMQIPLIVRHTGHIPANKELDYYINQYDIFPTLLDYTGLRRLKIANTPGKSFKRLLRGHDIKGWKNEAFFEFVTLRTIRTPEWKYTKRLDKEGEEALYNLEVDPEENVNLINHPERAEVIEKLDRKLTAFFSTYSSEEFDLWSGGTGKGILLDKYYGRNDIFRERFPNWRMPYIKNPAQTFTDASR